ncbi:type II secretion system protein GspL [Novosphingobium lentum]|uniref:type II secretion system protein GspL n=1 Tax=Novosphingobium lentum TaxID=145287 RepID=UPI000AC17977|nr:type II secretion system protein GspL [Novosphingobium lentum]
MPAVPDPLRDNGLLVSLPAIPGGVWICRNVDNGALGAPWRFDPADDRDLLPGDAGRVTCLVPAALAPVRDRAMSAMPPAQAMAAERLTLTGEGAAAQSRHVAVAAAEGGTRLLSSVVAKADMDAWLASLAAAGIDPAALVPAALALPPSADGVVTGELDGYVLARTRDAAFAGEPALVEAIAGDMPAREIGEGELAHALLALHRAPPLDLRQGPYAPRRVSYFRTADWGQLARMTAIAALLALTLMLVWIIRWNADSSSREAAALAAAQQRFPAATDLASAEQMASAQLARRGDDGAGFASPAAALLAAMRPVPSIRLRDMGYTSDGTLRFTAAAPRADDVNALLIALQHDGWQVTVPPELAPDPTGATVAAITLRAP